VQCCRRYIFRSALLSVRAMPARSLARKAYVIGQDVRRAAIHAGGMALHGSIERAPQSPVVTFMATTTMDRR